MDFFEKKELLKLLNHKMNYAKNERVFKQMSNPTFRRLISLLNRVNNFNDEDEFASIFRYYSNVLR